MSKKSLYIKELREQSPGELQATADKLRQTLDKMRIDQGFAKSGDVHALRKERRSLAQVQTRLNELKKENE